MSDFTRALPIILEAEGGYVDDPDDPGGATNFGITQKTYDAFRASIGKPRAAVKYITREEVGDTYLRDYWRGSQADAMAWPASLVHFDGAVNHGPYNAARILQRALHVRDDGAIGPQTQTAIRAADPVKLANDLLWGRLEFYREITAKAEDPRRKFFRGWVLRVLHLRTKVQLP